MPGVLHSLSHCYISIKYLREEVCRRRENCLKYYIRAAVFDGLVELVRQHKVDPHIIFDTVNLPTDIAQQTEVRVPYRKFLQSLEVAAQHTNCEHFGLLMSSHQGLSVLGNLSQTMEHATTVGAGLKDLFKFLSTHTDALQANMQHSGDMVRCSVEILEKDILGLPIQVDLIASTLVNTLRQIIGAQWSPDIIRLSRRHPGDRTPYDRRFRCLLQFDQEINAIEFPASVLNLPIRSANAKLYTELQIVMERRLRKSSNSFFRQLQIAILLGLYDGACGIDDIAKSLGMSRRKLQRKIKEEGMTFTNALTDQRNELARRYLKYTDIDLTSISEVLGYSQVSIFSRAFRQTNFIPPSQYRHSSRLEGNG